MGVLEDNLQAVQWKIETAARRSDRNPDDVRLIAVSKRQSAESVRTLMQAGQRDFAENQMQEALGKIAELDEASLHWHFIGHLQSNKTRFVAGNFVWIHSVDSEKLVARIASAVAREDATANLLLQVNVADDPAKHGIQPRSLFPLVERVLEQRYPGVSLRGLMTIGRRGASESETRRAFAALRELLEQCQRRFGQDLRELSMGMSADYEIAIEEGATMVRVGTGLFGERVVV